LLGCGQSIIAGLADYARQGTIYPMPIWPDDNVILYDGQCPFCASWVRFVAIRDVGRRFRFTPITTDYGRALAAALGIAPGDPDTNAVVITGRGLRRSDAALAVLATLPGWGWVTMLRMFPRALRDGVYRLIARSRYQVFGRNELCDFGGPALRGRVIVDLPATDPAR
jgi:predicted DCC family thiol-disulfide oxidoreductase YuxK